MSELVKKYRASAEKILMKNDPSLFVYHTIDHTRAVVGAFNEIATACNLSKKEMAYGEIAAWYHDTGYAKDLKSHEQASVDLFLASDAKDDFDQDEIRIISNLILSTKMPQNPSSTLEKVLCDADVHHIGTDKFIENSNLLKIEMENLYGIPIRPDSWRLENYNFLIGHKFHTDFANQKYNLVKEENIDFLKSGIKEIQKREKKIKKLEAEVEKLNEKLLQKPARGIETMFRITSRNHLQLSSMADSKANIMISVNTIIISVVMTYGATRLAEYPYLILPMTALVTVCLVTIVLSILATRPKISKGTFTREDIENKKTNLLFFGNFHGMELEDYQWGVSEMMKDADYLYNSLSRDVYYLGKVLGKKYRMLRAAYTTFMIGFVVNIILFVIAAYWNNL